jgi:hypothetical protein
MNACKIKRPEFKISGIVLDCPNAEGLANFYQRLLGWEKTHSGDEWAGITSPEGLVLAFQTVEEYEPPVWPWLKSSQEQMMHFDLKVINLNDAVEFAVSCGANIANTQFYNTSRTMIDPAGHTFCLDTNESN